ncbi:MAG TPA: hypothetical protein VK856_01840 [Anaerolineaceae bacterium]|nr:hypothetical protein [Anaerolineaceae bacterium]
MKKIFYTIISLISGVIVILGLFFPETILNELRQNLLNWTIILSSVSLIIAILSLLTVHWKRIFSDSQPDYSSTFFILGFLIVLFIGFILGPSSQLFLTFNKSVLISVESSLLGVLSITLAVASFKFFRKKQDLLAIVFGISTIIFLLLFSGILSSGGNPPFIRSIISGLNSLPIAGSTGILIGISLGAIITSLRALFGLNRPFDR